MLVLSRRAEEEIKFVNLGISVRVLKVRGQIVKIGIDAPRDIKVMRSEACGTADDSIAVSPVAKPRSQHALRNHLNVVMLRLRALQKQIENGEMRKAHESLDTLLHGASAADVALGPRGVAAVPDEFGQPCRLLVVEDADNERQLMAYLLATHGFDVSVARDGGEAMEYLAHATALPRCILMDVNMPIANGTATLQWIREDQRLANLSVFAVTGCTRIPELEPVGHGWDGWFVKPIDVELLLASIPNSPVSPLVA